jgi:hypothetical protein
MLKAFRAGGAADDNIKTRHWQISILQYSKTEKFPRMAGLNQTIYAFVCSLEKYKPSTDANRSKCK